MKKVIKEQVKSEVSKITPKIEKLVNEQLESEVLVRSLKEAKTSHAVADNLSELELKKILINKMEANKSINRSDVQRQLYKALIDVYKADKILLDTYGHTVTIKRPRDGADDDQEPSAGTDQGSKRRSQSAPVEETMQSTEFFEAPAHQEFETSVHDAQPEEEVHPLPDWFQQPNRLPSPDHAWNKSVPAVHESVQPWLSNLARRQDPRESFDELTDTTFDFSTFVMNRLNKFSKPQQKNWTRSPQGRQYLNDLAKAHYHWFQTLKVVMSYRFITSSITTLSTYVVVSQVGSTLLQESHIGAKSEDNSMHLRSHGNQLVTDDDILYKFKEGDFHRHRIQDIEDMLLLLVQGKLTNLNVKERISFNVSLRLFTRSVVIQRRVEDIQLGVESYQKKLNLTKPDTYRSNLRRRDAYIPYSDPRGFIYENKDKKNRLMRIDELYKFSDGTLDDVRTALNDRLKGIRMEYRPQTFCSQHDKVCKT
ncbi:hypothetical protein Tco_1147615 [Tanacetum coccineum]